MSLKFPRGRGESAAIDLLAYELHQEKAATLSRLWRKAREALDALSAFDAAATPTRDAEARTTLVRAAGEALWYYVIQREVCGLRDGEAVLRELRVPREVRLEMRYHPRGEG